MIRNAIINNDNFLVTFVIKPTDDSFEVDITDELFDEMTDNGYHNYKYENGNFVFIETNTLMIQYYEELLSIKKWFSQTDWIPNKIITKEWEETDQRWADYLNERQAKRNRQDELMALLS